MTTQTVYSLIIDFDYSDQFSLCIEKCKKLHLMRSDILMPELPGGVNPTKKKELNEAL